MQAVCDIESAEACMELCRERGEPPCSHWVWYALQAGRWAKQCVMVEVMDSVYRTEDNHTVTGTCHNGK